MKAIDLAGNYRKLTPQQYLDFNGPLAIRHISSKEQKELNLLIWKRRKKKSPQVDLRQLEIELCDLTIGLD